MGTGNGQAAAQLAAHFAHVYASDPSVEQIGAAKPTARVTFAVEAAEQCSLADGSVDLVLAAQSLHWFNQPLFAGEVRRVLKPGGVLAAIGYSWFRVDPDVDRVIDDAFLQPLKRLWAEQNRLLWEDYRGIDLPGTELVIPDAAIERLWTCDELLAYLRTWSATQKWLAANEGEGFAGASQKLRSIWAGDERRPVVMPLVVRATRLS